jgi:large subunit ribosomal protein L22
MQQEITAKLKYLKTGPRKVRLVVDMIRGKKVLKAIELLTMLQKKVALPLLKFFKSAVANAKHNYSLEAENLRVAKITVDGGPVLKRWTPRARGRATMIRKRTSHVELVLQVIEQKDNIKKK